MTTEQALRILRNRYHAAAQKAEGAGAVDQAELCARRRDQLAALIGHRTRQENRQANAARAHDGGHRFRIFD